MVKSVSAIGKAAIGAHKAIEATAKELHGLKRGAVHTETAAQGMQTLAQESRRVVRATKAVTAMTVRGARAQARAQIRAARAVQPVSLRASSAVGGLPAAGSRRIRSRMPAIARGGLPPTSPAPRQARGGSP